MIKYLLRCNDCEQEFESWFSASSEYDRLFKLKLLNCQSCESINVEKSLMSPNLLNTKKKENLKELKKIDGMTFNPILNKWSVTSDKSVNYISEFKKV